MTLRYFSSNFIETNTAKTRHCSRKEFINKICCQANGFEDLSTGVGRNSGDTHLGHHLQYTLAGCLDVVLHCFVRVHSAKAVHAGFVVGCNHVFNRFKSQVWVNCACTKTDKQCHVMHFASITTFHNKTYLGATLLTNEVMMHSACEQQRWNGGIHIV